VEIRDVIRLNVLIDLGIINKSTELRTMCDIEIRGPNMSIHETFLLQHHLLSTYAVDWEMERHIGTFCCDPIT
jgi:hypothetical protein